MDRDALASTLIGTLQHTVDAGIPGVVAALTIDGETVFEGAAGVRQMGAAAPMTTDTVLAIFSMTKAVTAAAAMQLVEQGRLSLDAPASEVLPDLGDLQVLEGFADDGTPRLRPARTTVTLRHLLAHTSGHVYPMWNADFARYLQISGTPGIGSGLKAALRTPIMFDPGSRWEYGTGIDWAGLMVEAASGTTLGRYCTQHLFEPLDMSDTAFSPTASMQERAAGLHVTTPDGIVPFAMPRPAQPEFESGGGDLFSTVGDYLRFTNMILGGGALDGIRVLQADTVAQMGSSHTGAARVVPMISAHTMLTCDVDFFPGMEPTWGLSFLINPQRSAEGRPAGSLAWAGLANSFYWIDPVNRVSAVWAAQLFPFVAPAALAGFRRFETAVYDALS